MQNRPCSGAIVSFEAEAAPAQIAAARLHGPEEVAQAREHERQRRQSGRPHWRLAKRNHIDVDAQPTIVLHAERLAHARELAREHWLRQDLCELKSNCKPICTPTSKLTVRRSTHNEIEAFVRDSAATDSADDEIVITYLVQLDGIRRRGCGARWPTFAALASGVARRCLKKAKL